MIEDADPGDESDRPHDNPFGYGDCPMCGQPIRRSRGRRRIPLYHWTSWQTAAQFEAADPRAVVDYEDIVVHDDPDCVARARRFSDMQRVDPHERRFHIAMRVRQRELAEYHAEQARSSET